MIYLDTHVVVWLYAGLVEKISQPVRSLINNNELTISPIVRLELQYLYEIERVTEQGDAIIADLANRMGLQVWTGDFSAVIGRALTLSWTRDPFDRLIAANASLNDDILISKDQKLRDHYRQTRW